MILGAAVLMGTTFLPVASIVTGVSGRDGWMSVLPGLAVGIPYGLMVLSLMAKYPQKNLLQITESLLGKWLGKIIGILYIINSGYLGGLLLAQLGDIYESSIMPLVPIRIFYLGGLLLVFYLVISGIEVFARFAEVIFPLIVIALVLNIGLSIPRIEQGELMPILAEGIKPLVFGALKVMPFSLSYLLFIAGNISISTGEEEFKQLKTGVWRAVFLVGILDTLVALIQILVFGPNETIRLVYGLLVLGKMVEVSRTVAGVESIFLGVWLGSVIIKIAASFFQTIWGLETVFGLKGLKWKIAVAAVFWGIATGFLRGASLILEIGYVDSYLTLPFVSVWIPVLWGVSRWRRGLLFQEVN